MTVRAYGIHAIESTAFPSHRHCSVKPSLAALRGARYVLRLNADNRHNAGG